MTTINFDFWTAFISVVLFGYEPEFRFVYEEGQAEDFVICYAGKDITGFGHCHGYWIDIDAIVEDWFDSEDVADIPELYDFYSNDDFYYNDEEEEDNNWFDAEDLINIPDIREWFDAEDFEDLDLEENWFFSSDIKNIPTAA